MDVITTTGFTVEGYRILDYHGIVYGKSTFSDLYFYQGKPDQEDAFNQELAKATRSMTAQAVRKGGNAVIGVTVSVHNTGVGALGSKLMVCMLSGTAVTIAPVDADGGAVSGPKPEKKSVVPIVDGDNYVCPRCNCVQMRGRVKCFECGVAFSKG